MTKPFRDWKVLPHGELTAVADGIWTVVGKMDMPLGDYPRRMTVVRLGDGRLVVYSAIALDEPEMRRLEGYGTPAFLVVPSAIHRLDARPWKDRYPGLFVVAPAGAREKVERVLPVDASEVDLGDPEVLFISVPGTGEREAALLVDRPSGATLIVNDLIWNLDDKRGLAGWLMRKAGFTGHPAHIPPLVSRKLIRDRSALRAQIDAWSRLDHLDRIIVSHGDIVSRRPRDVLEAISRSLAA